MKDRGEKTDLSGMKQARQEETDSLTAAFQKLDLELRTQKFEDSMEDWYYMAAVRDVYTQFCSSSWLSEVQ